MSSAQANQHLAHAPTSVSTGPLFRLRIAAAPDYGGPSLTLNGFPTPPKTPNNPHGVLLSGQLRDGVQRREKPDDPPSFGRIRGDGEASS